MKIRRIALGALIGMPLALGAGAAAAYSYLPQLVGERVARVARERYGMRAEVGGVSLGVNSLNLEKVRIFDEAGGTAVRLKADRIELAGSPWRAALQGPGAFRGADVSGLSLEVQADAPAYRALLDRIASKDAIPRGRKGADRPVRRITVEDGRIEVRDALGDLLHVKDAQATWDAGGLRVEAGDISLGGGPFGRLAMHNIALEATRGGTGLALAKATVQTAALRLPDPPPTATSQVAVKTGDSDSPLEAALPAPSPAPGLRARLGALRSSSSVKPSDSPKPNGGETGGPLARLAPGLSIVVHDGTVSSSTSVLLEGVEASVKGTAKAAFRLKGDGRASEGGTLSWDFRIWPVALRADGELVLKSLPLSLLAPALPNVPWYESQDSRVDARVIVKAESVSRLSVSGSASVSNASVSSPRIAPVPVRGLDVGVSGTGYWLPLQRRLEIEEGRIHVGETTTELNGAVEWTKDHYSVALDAVLPPTPCNKVFAAVPRDLLADLAKTRWMGTFGGKLRINIDSRNLKKGELEFDVRDRCEFTAVPVMADLRRFRMPFVHSVVEPDGSLFEMDTGPGTANWTYLEDITPFVVHAVLSHEDTQFFNHAGFSPAHIRRALIRNLQEGRYVVGASTITMQLVKNVFLRREKTLARKIQEVILTWWIERVMDKREILELYLNVIEYGPGVYGIRNGARHYFNRLPSELSPAEAVYLSTVLPNPKRYHAAFERGSISTGWADRMRKIFRRMSARGWYDEDAVAFGLAELGKFKFTPEGTLPSPRTVPGTTSPLPYERSFDAAWEGEPPPDGVEPDQAARPPDLAAPQ